MQRQSKLRVQSQQQKKQFEAVKIEGALATNKSESGAGKIGGAIASTESASVGPTAASGALVIDPICVKPGPMS